jgi:hypothetical protein
MRKINIHLALDKPAIEYCMEVNAGIRSISDSVIVFDVNSPMIPHISLVMGTLLNDVDLLMIKKVVEEAASEFQPIQFHVFPPYLENVRTRYIFSDVEDGKGFVNLKNKLQQSLQDKYMCIQNDYSDQAHLTLGHIENNREEVKKHLHQIRANFDFLCTEIEFSDVGPKGTCINSLFRISL